ncbi:hypothetical protein F3Y22_tig00015910pilonHSYRG00066 [Hibiscus syriacus]|uniref:Uncharacterized protein n=1 Tax=Hibiscus syriacus TaxID=106335 RepID=A0A6A3BXY4_HIBSY|nr:uncharacterized protein LOC120208115 [Hibiscus syriacus]XP_039063400.1 uncharacterized protein LOC120208115 [Hibiscus syriacus]XP_039063402.1 uncharacterized protein LOC120208115 [Hibiscus syriacus]KAE8721495.1 hypothetical protein F3Y22_tig00015910pilonHSYRG00066 [Hibiscus syriacus]
MAAAEARAVWQRTANRCFVQEDAKRAPKLACCQSSSSTNQADSSPTDAADTNHHPSTGFMPLNRNPSYSNLPPDTRWWLQLQPSYGPQMGLTHEQLNALEDEVESLKAVINSSSKVSRSYQQDSHDVSLDSKMTMENWEVLDMEFVECHACMKTNDFCYEPESPWSDHGKAEPWWRKTDKDELVSLVAQKSLDYIENCDLPPPQNVNVRKYSHACSGSFDSGEVSSLVWKPQKVPVYSSVVNAPMSPDSIRKLGTQMASVGEGQIQCASDTSSSTSTTKKDILEQVTESNPTKAQLLEALCHSQSRAREAEKAAKQAYAEKEHVIRLVFKQASQLFAYKQWFQILQLEALYVQIKNNEQPLVLPCTPYKSQKMQKGWQKTGKERRGKRGRPRPDITRYAVALALGLGLVGAGLLLGWTVGWMLPL